MSVFVTGTDTDVGKTVVSAWLVHHLAARYWKPVQCGTDDGVDSQRVKDMTGSDDNHIVPSTYVLPDPLSPHEAAKRAGVHIEMEKFVLPDHSAGPIVVEGAGGLMVPLNERSYVADLIVALGLQAVLVCRSTLGTINHTLLSLACMRERGIKVAGVVLNGPKTPHNRQAIEEYGKVRVICEMPLLDEVSTQTLRSVAPEVDLGELFV